jgi:biopolymer transport protein ExbD
MAKRKREPPNVEADEFDLTPMIDVTFQLIIFFLVANDLTRKEVEEIQLPQALAGVEDKAPEEHRVIINIAAPDDPENPPPVPVIKVRGQVYDLPTLKVYMQSRADIQRDAAGASEIYVLVRADKNTPWSHVQYVMQVCADPMVMIYKMQFATTKTDDGKATTHAQAGN